MIQNALDTLLDDSSSLKNFGRVGYVTNQSSTTATYIPSIDAFYAASQKTQNCTLTALFGPQHGYFQTEQDNMRETPDDFYVLNNGLKIPLYSLYSNTREPLEQHLENIDTLVVDLQDIGCRVYTYMLTLAGCLRSASKYNKRVVVLDRINPVGLAYFDKNQNTWTGVEGNCLNPRFHSFVGWYPIPLRHGMTMGELGNYFIEHDKLDVDYTVLPVKGLTRSIPAYNFSNLPWVMPSPNIPSWKNAFMFPAFVCLEGTNISEGRGSTIPFELVGAPWLDALNLISFVNKNQNMIKINPDKNLGLTLRPHQFRPTFNKHHGHICHGVHFGITDTQNVNLYGLGLLFMYFCALNHENQFEWSQPGYEYNFEDTPINLILGSEDFYNICKSPTPNCHELVHVLENSKKESDNFIRNVSQKHFIYPE